METKEFVDSLFKGYEETAALADFKEELLANLNAKIECLVKKGENAQAAYEKARAELGDVSALADELSLKKRKEVFEEVYMDVRNFMDAKRVAGYVACGMLALFGIIAAFIVLFSKNRLGTNFELSGVFGTMLPFLSTAAAGFTWLAMTQETASTYPTGKIRAVWYAVAVGLIAFGILTAPTVLFCNGIKGERFSRADAVSVLTNNGDLDAAGAISVLIPFVLPGIGLLVFLILTEKDRLKPWAKDFRDKTAKSVAQALSDPSVAMRFGMFSGAIWIFAFGLFAALGFLIGFRFSWTVFIFATAFQLLLQGFMSDTEKR